MFSRYEEEISQVYSGLPSSTIVGALKLFIERDINKCYAIEPDAMKVMGIYSSALLNSAFRESHDITRIELQMNCFTPMSFGLSKFGFGMSETLTEEVLNEKNEKTLRKVLVKGVPSLQSIITVTGLSKAVKQIEFEALAQRRH